MRTKTILTILLAMGASDAAKAAIYKVGPLADSQCTHNTIAAAIAAAAANPGADTIRLAMTQSHANQALTINSDDDLAIIGGFIACSRTTPEPGVKVVIDGATGSVFRIFGNGRVSLRQLEISGGNATGASEGGGIYYQGNGTLDIADSDIINNTAGYGGGIYARGTGAAAELQIGANVTVANNTARYSGGGVYIDQLEMAMREPNSGIFYNTALGADDSGYGGGLTIRAAQRSAYAYVGTGGIANAGAIFANEARYGGGGAVVGGDAPNDNSEDAVLQLYTTDPAKPASIRGNIASVAGGGVFLADYFDERGSVSSDAFFYNARLDDNEAPRGAAAFADGGLTGIFFNPAWRPVPVGTVACGPFALCGGIADNRVEDSDGNPADGAVIELVDSNFQARSGPAEAPGGGIEIRANAGGRLLRPTGDRNGYVTIDHAVITANEVSADLVSMDVLHDLYLKDTTIAGNTIGAAHMIWAGRSTAILGSILWQPVSRMIAGPATQVAVTNTIASETLSLNGGGYYAAPRFIDPARGNYGLRAASPAVDFRAARSDETAASRDALGNPRVLDLSLVPNYLGPVDLGAIERQSSFPLVLNGNFEDDANLWSSGSSGTSTWTSAQNFPGSPGGSVRVAGPAFVAVGSAQCVHLPVAARYLLSGVGRNAVATNTVSLAWEFRREGGENCTNGAAERSGSVLLSDSTQWWGPVQPAAIEVTESDWTSSSSITIRLVASGRQPDGWFDDITLTTSDLVDRIFANGFD